MKYIIFLILIFTGCSIKQPVSYAPYIITIKTKAFRYSDIGYIKKYKDSVTLEIYSAGTPVLKLKIGKNVCFENGCISKKSFNEKFLVKNYPENLFKNVILGKPIFKSKNVVKTKNGFKQKIFQENRYDIIYIVNKDKIYFKDRINRVLVIVSSE